MTNSQDSATVIAEWPKGALRPVIDHRGQQVIQIRHALLLFFLLTLSFSLNSARAIAQDEPGSEAPELDDSIVIEEVFVTGSLLPKGDFVSKAPIATISSTQYYDVFGRTMFLKLTGRFRMSIDVEANKTSLRGCR